MNPAPRKNAGRLTIGNLGDHVIDRLQKLVDEPSESMSCSVAVDGSQPCLPGSGLACEEIARGRRRGAGEIAEV